MNKGGFLASALRDGWRDLRLFLARALNPQPWRPPKPS